MIREGAHWRRDWSRAVLRSRARAVLLAGQVHFCLGPARGEARRDQHAANGWDQRDRLASEHEAHPVGRPREKGIEYGAMQ